MNKFGGNWTQAKIEILIEYAQAYLTIMNAYADKYNWKLLYFDGFAGSGYIQQGDDNHKRNIIGAANRILELNDPRPFDRYYFVEKDTGNAEKLVENTVIKYPNKLINVVSADCNSKIESMGNFLSSNKGKNYKVLAYIDPCGMQLNWKSLTSLQKLKIDAWILIPTGLGVNRLLKRDGKISDAWIERLEHFLGMKKEEILSQFYSSTMVNTLFGNEIVTTKEDRAIEKSANLYKERLGELFEFVSKPYILKNRSNSIMFHFLMVSNNKTAVNVANDIIDKYNRNF